MAELNLDVEDKSTGEAYTVYRCSACYALVLSEDYLDHYSWHERTDSLGH